MGNSWFDTYYQEYRILQEKVHRECEEKNKVLKESFFTRRNRILQEIVGPKPRKLTLQEVVDIAVSVGLANQEDLDINKHGYEEVERKARERISSIAPFSVLKKKMRDGSFRYYGYYSGCFISTACVEAAHLPDDCDELQTLRRFRDEYIAQLPQGSGLIKHYYDIAPRIVRAIQTSSDSHDIFSRIYEDDVLVTADSFRKGYPEKAFDQYTKMVSKLKREHLQSHN